MTLLNNTLTRSPKRRGQMLCKLLLMLRKISDQTISKSSLIGSSTRPNKFDQSQKNGHKIKKTANSDDLLGNMQLKLSFCDWRISILSSKKCQTSIILADLLGNESFLQRVQKVIVYDLWLVDFDPFLLFLCFKVRCLWSYCDQNPTLKGLVHDNAHVWVLTVADCFSTNRKRVRCTQVNLQNSN